MCSECRLANQVCALPVWAPKPYLSCANYRKVRVGGVVGSEIGGKKGRSGGRGRAFSVVAASV